MNILIIGGNGFIGSHLVDALLQKGHQVRVFDRQMEKYRQPLPEVDYLIGSFNDSIYLTEALQGMNAVVHLASSTVPATSNLNPEVDIETNLVSTVKLLELMRTQGPKKILFPSSGGTVYGNPETLPVSETHRLAPISSYGIVKVAIENYLMMYHNLYGLEPCILRISNPYGPRQGHIGVQGLISSFLNNIKKDQNLTIWGDGEVKRDYIYISDLAHLCVSALESDACGIVNAGSGIGTSINDVINYVADVTQQQPVVDYHVGRDFDVKEIYLDISKAKQIYGWSPTIGFKEGINKHWEWMCSYAQSSKI